MSGHTWTHQASWSTDQDVRDFITGMHNALAAIGLVQTADTGQVNPATVTLPATGAVAGYEVWRFDDAQQAAFPLFLRIEYMRGSTGSQPPGFYLTVGQGSNGAGTLTGVLISRASVTTPSTASGLTTSYASSDGHGLYVLTGAGMAGVAFIVDRARNADGSVRVDAILRVFSSSFAVLAVTATAYASSSLSGLAGWNTSTVPTYAMSQNPDGDAEVERTGYRCPGVPLLYLGMTVGVFGGDLDTSGLFTVDLPEGPVTFQNPAGLAGNRFSTSNNMAFPMRWS